MRILVIEDDPTVGQYVKRGLEEQRYAVDLVADGDEGERRASSEAYDLVIVDMRLPKKTGLEELNSLRAKGFEKPVLVLTAQDAVVAKVATLRAGDDDHVTKSFAFIELRDRVDAISPNGQLPCRRHGDARRVRRRALRRARSGGGSGCARAIRVARRRRARNHSQCPSEWQAPYVSGADRGVTDDPCDAGDGAS